MKAKETKFQFLVLFIRILIARQGKVPINIGFFFSLISKYLIQKVKVLYVLKSSLHAPYDTIKKED